MALFLTPPKNISNMHVLIQIHLSCNKNFNVGLRLKNQGILKAPD